MQSSIHRFTWSSLPPLQLKGVGTSRVESLEHYVLRQAWTVGVTMANMMSIVGPAIAGGRRGQVMGSGKYCGPSRDFSHRISTLKMLTAQDDLQCGTFWVLEDVLATYGGGRDTTRRRWCPVCYRDWDDDLSYEPLSWIVDIQAECDLHKCKLETTCSRCGADQPSSTDYQRRRRCHKCKQSLSGDGAAAAITGDEAWGQQQLASIIELCATPSQPQIPFENYVRFVKLLVDGHPMRRAYPNALKAEFYRATKNLTRGRTTIRAIVNLCALQSISARDILLSPDAAASEPLLDLWFSYATLKLPVGRHAERLERCAKCFSDVLKASEKDHYVPQMKVVLRRFRLNRQLLREMHLDVYEEYKLRHEEQGPYSQRVHLNRAMDLALQMVEGDADQAGSHRKLQQAAKQIGQRCNVSLDVGFSVMLGARNVLKALSENRLRKQPSGGRRPHSVA